MNRIKLLPALALFALIFSGCHNGPIPSPSVQSMIVGKWTLQKQSFVQYQNSVKQIDTTCTAADTLTAYAQFNADRSFTSQSHLFSKNLNLNAPIEEGTSTGIYTVQSDQLTVSQTLAGFYYAPAIFSTTNNIPSTSSFVHSSKLISLSTDQLALSTQDDYTVTVNGNAISFNNTSVFYYTR